MRIAKGTVIDGRIVVDGETLNDGQTVTVLVSDERSFTLTADEESLLLQSIAQADRGELVDVEGVLDFLP